MTVPDSCKHKPGVAGTHIATGRRAQPEEGGIDRKMQQGEESETVLIMTLQALDLAIPEAESSFEPPNTFSFFHRKV